VLSAKCLSSQAYPDFALLGADLKTTRKRNGTAAGPFEPPTSRARTRDSGKTRSQAGGEVNARIDRLRRADLDARKMFGEYAPGDWDPMPVEAEAVVRREPYGVVLVIILFNYPLFDTVSKFV